MEEKKLLRGDEEDGSERNDAVNSEVGANQAQNENVPGSSSSSSISWFSVIMVFVIGVAFGSMIGTNAAIGV